MALPKKEEARNNEETEEDMELISKEKMLEKLAMVPAYQFYNVASIRNFIKAEEEAVTRCEDCKWLGDPSYCPDKKDIMDLGDFCSWGERKDGR